MYNIHNKDELLSLLQKNPDGIDVDNLKDAYAGALDDLRVRVCVCVCATCLRVRVPVQKCVCARFACPQLRQGYACAKTTLRLSLPLFL